MTTEGQTRDIYTKGPPEDMRLQLEFEKYILTRYNINTPEEGEARAKFIPHTSYRDA